MTTSNNVPTITPDDVPELVKRARAEEWRDLAIVPKWSLTYIDRDELRNVFLSTHGIGDEGAAALGSLTNLSRLDLRNNGIGDAGATSLATLKNLTRLDLQDNRIGEAGAASLATLTNLTRLDLRNNGIGNDGAASLAAMTNLTELQLHRNGIGEAGAAALVTLTDLTKLGLGVNRIGDAGAASLTALTNLTELYVGFNEIGDAGAASLAMLTNLTRFDLRNNAIGDAGAASLATLTNLTRLDLRDNGIGDAGAASLAALTNLTTLYVGSNGIGEAGAASLAAMTNLTTLYVGSNGIGEAGAASLATLTNLTTLELRGNGIGDAGAASLAALTNLTTLELGFNRIGEAGATSLATLTNLTTLELGFNGIGEAGAASLAALTNLTRLGLQENGIGEAGATSLATLTNLTRLDLRDNGVGDAGAASLAVLKNLTELQLRKNGIGETGAASLATLTNLTELGLGANRIGDAGATSLAALTNLTALYVGSNRIGEAGAASLATLTNLSRLDLRDNGIGDAGAAWLGTSTSLTKLNLRDNGISAAGAARLATLTNLTRLDLRDNDIGNAGATSLVALRNLTTLYLDRSGIGAEGIRTLLESSVASRLRWLSLKDNNVGFVLPSEVLNSTDAQAILAAYRRFRAEAREPGGLPSLNEAKLLVVGNEAVGKTSLIRYLVDGESRDPDEPKTPKAAIRERVDTEDWTPETCPVRLHVWDFGGQIMMHRTHRFFLTERSLYLLVLEARREDDRSVYDWLKTIRSRGGDSPVIVVTNKSDLKDHRLELDERRLKEDYAGIVAFLRTSCNDDEASAASIDALRATISETLLHDERLVHVRDPIPRSYLRIKERIAELSRDHQVLESSEYRRLCETVDETEHHDDAVTTENEQRALLRLLHDLGVVVAHGLTRDASAVRREITLLDPNWLTGAIYTVLMHPVLRDQQGQFHRHQLGEWLDSTDYPEQRHEFVLDMMQHPDVGLAFELPDRGEYLVPEALPKNQPDYGMWPDDSLRFRYEYDFLPPGLIPRFIVEAHRKLSDQPTRWYSGVVLAAAECRVLVLGNVDQNRVDILVSGKNAGLRRSALNVVLHDLEHVHSRSPEIRPTARVPLPDDPDVSVSYDFLLRLERERGLDYEFPVDGARRDYVVRELLEGVRRDSPTDPDDRRGHRTEPRETTFNVHAETGASVTVTGGDVRESTQHTRSSSTTAVPASEARSSNWSSWPLLSLACGAGAVLLAVVIWFLPSYETRAATAWLVGLFLVVTVFVLSFNPVNFYRRLLAYVIPGGFLVEAAGSTIDLVLHADVPDAAEATAGFHWNGAADGLFFIAWPIVIAVLVAGDCWTRRGS